MDNVILEAKDIAKTFGETKALVGVDLTVRGGEVHGLIGENGSGKSTLSSIIAGMQQKDRGTMQLRGTDYHPTTMNDAVVAGIRMIVQEQGTINDISVAANLFLGEEKTFRKNGLLKIGEMNDASRKALEAIDAGHINPRANINTVSLEDRKVVEIARAMYTDPILLIVDETTTALPRQQREILYRLMQKMRADNKAVLFISHDVDEIIEVCDRVTIMRDGSVTGVLSKEEMVPSHMKQLMVGRTIEGNYYRSDKIGSHMEEVALRAENIKTRVLKDVSFDAYRGEILGISGLTDSGMHDIGRVLYSAERAQSGRVVNARGQEITGVKQAIDNGIGYISKNRDMEALMLTGSIKDNICLPALPRLLHNGMITAKHERRHIEHWTEALHIKMNSSDQLVHSLSGGNKQKVSVAKWLALDSEIIIMDCPTRGIDVGVKADMYALMVELKAKGKTLIVISEEMPELIGMCDRILTMKDGRITNEFKRSEELSESQIIEYII